MKRLFNLLTIALLFSCMTACGDDDEGIIDCPNANSPFQLLYNDLVSNNYDDSRFMDTEIHEYTFELSAAAEICKIGYQSEADIATTPYTMKIIDSNGAEVYAGDHVFSAAGTSYASLNQNVSLNADKLYTIQRIQTNWNGNIGNTIGRMVRQTNMTFPYTQGILTITGANFYQNGGPGNDLGIPYIDMMLVE